MNEQKTVTVEEVWQALKDVKDPEIPVISVVGMGIITDVEIMESDKCIVTMTPTFVGCPAINMMKQDIESKLRQLGFSAFEVRVDLATRWRSDRMTTSAKQKLEKFGLAPPSVVGDEELSAEMMSRVRCPHCGSSHTVLRSTFGSTLCRAIRYCSDCNQAFEQFKPVT